MTTSHKLWLGFGTLTAVLVLSGVVTLIRMQSIERLVQEQLHVTRRRSAEAQQLEINLFTFALAVRTFTQTDDPKFRREAEKMDDTIAINLAEYRRHAQTERHRHLADRFAVLWREFNAFGQTVMNTEDRPIKREDSERLANLHIAIEKFLDDEVQVEAIQAYNASKDATLRYSRSIVRVASTLLLAGVVISLLTSAMASRAVVRGEQLLRESDRRKDEFLATLAHELRNPLAPIRTGLDLLRMGGNDAATTKETQSMMERQVEQMVRLVDDLLDVSRIARGKIQLRKERIDLRESIHRAVETCRPNLDGHTHDLSVTLPEAPVYLDADPVRIGQAISNVLHNAAKYTEKGGRIWLTVQPRDGEAIVSVRDTGIGIEPEQLPHIFDIFSQTKPALERSHGGLGIGLSLVKGLVELHGGTVEAHSEGIGRGSEFTVHLPIVAASAARSQDAAPPEMEVRASRPRRILVVDDNRDAANSLAMALQAMGHESYTVYDALDVLQAVASFRPHVVLLDIGMPQMNGYEVARRVREQPAAKGTALVAVSGWGQSEDKRRALDSGFDHHLTKPVETAALQNLLAQLR